MEIIWKIDLDTAADLEEVRIDDIKCNRIPTIEVLYQQQAPGGHFQFLCRVICSGILKPPICPDMTNVKDIMQQQTVVENWLPSAAEGTTTDDVAGGAIEQRPQVPEDGNTGNDIDNNIDETAQDSTTTGGDRDGIDIETTKAARSRLTTEDDVLDAVCAIIAHTEKRVYDSTLANAKKRKDSRAAKKKRVELGQDTKIFNQMCRNGEIPATRMLLDSTANKCYTYNVENKPTESTGKHVPIKRTEVVTGSLHLYNAKLIRCATETPDRWSGQRLKMPMSILVMPPWNYASMWFVCISNTTSHIVLYTRLRVLYGIANFRRLVANCRWTIFRNGR